jgi:hypothetical protein
MHLSKNPVEQVSESVPRKIHTILIAMSLSVASCIWPQNNHWSVQAFETDEITECDIDNPVFISLVGIGAELQASVNADKENAYTLEYVWQVLKSELEKRTESRDVSVSIVSPIQTERGYIYIEISASDKNWKIWKNWLYARNKEAAEERIQALRDNFMLYIKEKMAFMSPTWVPPGKDAIIQILQIEKEAFEKHKMTYEVQPDGENWVIVFHYTWEEKFGLICLWEESEQ